MGRIRIVKTGFEAAIPNKVPKETESFSLGEQVYFMHRRENDTVFAGGSDVVHAIESASQANPTGSITIRGGKQFVVTTRIFDASTDEGPPPTS